MSWKTRAKPVSNSMPVSAPTQAAEPQTESPGNPFLSMAAESAKNFGNAMIHGRPIAEHMPFGETIGNAGTALGNALVAATTKGPGETFGSVYDQLGQRSDADLAKQKAADAASPLATITKSTLAGLPIGVMKSAAPAKEAIEETVKQAPGWLSSKSKYSVNPPGTGGDPTRLVLSETEAAGKTAQAIEPSKLEKMKAWLKLRMAKEGYDMLPYAVRKGIDIGKTVSPHVPETVKMNLPKAVGPAHGLFETWLDETQ